MKDKNGKKLRHMDVVKIGNDFWQIFGWQDRFGDVEVVNKLTGQKLHRHPSSLQKV